MNDPVRPNHERVARPDRGPNLRQRHSARGRERHDFGERPFEVLLDVVAERFEGRDVEDLGVVLQLAGDGLTDESIDADKKC